MDQGGFRCEGHIDGGHGESIQREGREIPRVGHQRPGRRRWPRRFWCPSSSPTTGQSTRTLSGDGRTLHPTSRLTGCGWPRTSFSTMWSLLGDSSTRAAGSPRLGRKVHPEEMVEERDGPPEIIATAAERREMLRLDTGPESAVCVRSSGTPPPHSARLRSAGRGITTSENEQANQPT